MSRTLYYLRHCFDSLSRFCNNDKFFETSYVENLSDILKKLTIASKQYKIILNTLPEEDTLNVSQTKVVDLDDNVDFPRFKHDFNWNKLHASFNSIMEISAKTQTAIDRCSSRISCSNFELKRSKLIPAEDGQLISANLEIITEKCGDILTIFKDTHLEDSLKWLLDQIVESKNKFELKTEDSTELSDVEELKRKIEKSSTKMLLVIQEIFKKYSTKDERNEEEDEKRTDLEEDLLKTSLIDNLSNDIKELNTKGVLKSAKKVLELFHCTDLPLNENGKLVTKQYLSLLDQIILLYQYFLTQQVSTYRVTSKLNSVLLNVFIELAGKVIFFILIFHFFFLLSFLFFLPLLCFLLSCLLVFLPFFLPF